MDRVPSCEQADAKPKRPAKWHQFVKKRKRRLERHKAKLNPDCQPSYGRYKGWET